MDFIYLEVLEGLEVKVYRNGTIETLDHKTIRKNGRIDNRRGKFLKPAIDKYGYYRIAVSHNGKRKNYLVHTLVAKAFIENPLNKPTVNHKDGNKLNNNADNLEWATNKEQKEHAIKTGLAKNNMDALIKANERKSIPVLFRGKEYPSIKAASRENKVGEATVKKEGIAI